MIVFIFMIFHSLGWADEIPKERIDPRQLNQLSLSWHGYQGDLDPLNIDLSDPNWQILSPEKPDPLGASELWYSKTIQLEEGQESNPQLDLYIGLSLSAVEVYADGQLLWKNVDIVDEEVPASRVAQVAIPPDLWDDDEVLLSLRTWVTPAMSNISMQPRIYRMEHISVGPPELVSLFREKEAQLTTLRFRIPKVIVGFLFYGLAIFHFNVFWRRRDQKAYFWYCLILLLAGTTNILVGLHRWEGGLVGADILPWYAIHGLFDHVLEIQFLHVFMLGTAPSKRWRVLQGILLGLSAIILLTGGPNTNLIPIQMLMPLVMMAGLTILGSILVRAYRGAPGGRVLGICYVVAFTVLWISILSAGGVIPAAPIEIDYFPQVLVCTGMAVALANQFTSNMDSLDQSNQSLESINKAIRRFVPFEFLDLLRKESIQDIQRGDHVQLEVAVLFTDIRGFTSLSEKMSAAETFDFVNDYLGQIQPTIQQHQGVVGTYLGDGIMAVFHTGTDDAVASCISQFSELERFNQKLVRNNKEPIEVGMGINTGPLMLGTIGGEDRIDCTIIGDAVNLAARVEGMTKMYGARLILTESAVKSLDRPEDWTVRELDRVLAKGKKEPVAIFEVLEAASKEDREQKMASLDEYKQGLERFRNGNFQDARDRFIQCQSMAPADKVISIYLQRCKDLMASGAKDGSLVTELTEK
jgi:class 3 adenylate cyclase